MSKKKIFLFVFFASLVVGIIMRHNLFYWFQTWRFKQYNEIILSEQKNFTPSIFSGNTPKLWVHHVNNVKRLQKLLPDFNGFECDIFYNIATNSFEVYHDSSEASGLQLEEYLKLPNTSLKYFWFDFKNLNAVNAGKALQLFNHLDFLYHIKQRVIIESSNPLALRTIADAGYFTSYYIPVFNLVVYSSINAYVDSVKRNIYPEFKTVSQGEETILALDTLLPGINKLTWLTSGKLAFVRKPLQTFYFRSDIKIILVEILTEE